MGHGRDCQEAVEWHADLSLEQREESAPFQSAFSAGKTGAAASALGHAQHQAEIARWVLKIVQEQAVWACLDDGMSIRATADQLKMAKSQVGRIAKLFGQRNGAPTSRTIFPIGLKYLQNDVSSNVRDCWSRPKGTEL